MKLIDEILEYISKNTVLVLSITIGAFLKAAIDIKTKQMTWWERLLNVAISVCVGWVAWRVLMTFDKTHYTGFIVPLATLLGETIATWTIINSSFLLNRLVEKYLPVKSKRKK